MKDINYKKLPLSVICICGGLVMWGVIVNSLALTVFGLLGFILFEEKTTEDEK